MSRLTIVEGNSNDKDNVRVIMVKGEKGEKGDNGEITYSDVVDNLTSTETQKPLSAKQGKILKGLIDATPYKFDSVAEMVATNLSNGSFAITTGYYTANDGGGGEYNIVNDNTLTADGGSIINLTNGLKAVLIIKNDTINVKQFGAVGDGTTNDTVAIQNALKFREDTYIKVLFNENEIYCAKEEIHIYSNTDIVLNNSTIKSIYSGDNQDTYVQFGNGLRFLNSKNTIENFSIINGNFNGNTSGVLFGLLHGKNLKFENLNLINCAVGTHIFDLGGCEDVIINNCYFKGCYIVDNNSYREMIQTDYASSDGLPYWDESYDMTYDNSPCKNITIKNCVFEKGSGTQYPTAIGQHAVKDDISSNITIINNKFYGCATGSSFIRFYKVKNLLIEDNYFYNQNSSHTGDAYAIQIRSQSTSNPDPNPIASTDIKIRNNNFITNTPNTTLMFIQVFGYSDLNFNDIHIENNNYNGTKAKDVFEIGNVSNINIKENNVLNGKYFIIKTRNSYLDNYNVNNNYVKDCNEFIHLISNDTITTSTRANIDNNIWECNTSGEECKYINSSYRNNFIFSVDQQVNSNQEYKMRLNLKEKDDDIDVRATWSNPAIWIPSHLRKLKISGKFYLNTTNTNDVKEIKIYANDGSADTLIGCQKVLLVNSGYNMLELSPIYYEISDIAQIHGIYATITMKAGDQVIAQLNDIYSNYLTIESY